MISLIMIVQNEEAVLSNCLKYAQPHVDRMVLIDGGSTDSTVSIAQRYNAEVYEHLFENHFANQRNKLLNYAKEGWGLWLDADEVLCLFPDRLKRLVEYLEANGYDSASFNRANLHNDSIESLDRHTRLFKLGNSPVRWEGKISESLIGLQKTYHTDYTILHAKTWDSQKKQNRFYYKIAPEFYDNKPDGVE